MAAFYTVQLVDEHEQEAGARFINIDAIRTIDLINRHQRPEENDFRVSFLDGSVLEISGAPARGFFEAVMKHHVDGRS